MTHNPGSFSRRDLLRWGAVAGAGLVIGGCDVGGSGGKGSAGASGGGSGKITALFMKQAAYSEDDVRKMTADFHAANPTTDVTSQFPASWKTEKLGGALSTAQYQDKFYGVPWILDTKYFFYNKDLLAKGGIDENSLSTWDGVLAAAKTLKDKKVVDKPFI